MDKVVGVTLQGMLVSKDVAKVVVFVGSITSDLTSNVVHSHPKNSTSSSICIPFLVTGIYSLSSFSPSHHHHHVLSNIMFQIMNKLQHLSGEKRQIDAMCVKIYYPPKISCME